MRLIISILLVTLIFSCEMQPSNSNESNSGNVSSNSSSFYPSGPEFLTAGKSEVSGLPYPPLSNFSKPEGGNPTNIIILDWAGFKAAVSFTFDDGQPSQVQHYTNLNKMEVPLTFFLSGGWGNNVVGYISNFRQAVSDGHEIGNHTFTHCYANLTSPATGGATLSSATEEINSNKIYIQNVIGQNQVYTMASPYGDSSWKQYASNSVFIMRGVWKGLVAPLDNTDPFNLPSYMPTGGETVHYFATNLTYAYTNKKWIIFCLHSILPGDNWYAGINITEITNGIKYAKLFGDMWIDTFCNIGAYWRGQKIVKAALSSNPIKTTINGTNYFTYSWNLPENFPQEMYLRVSNGGGTLMQNNIPLEWDTHGFYEISLDAKELTVVIPE